MALLLFKLLEYLKHLNEVGIYIAGIHIIIFFMVHIIPNSHNFFNKFVS